jgi:endo-1,4-beta-xylanase
MAGEHDRSPISHPLRLPARAPHFSRRLFLGTLTAASILPLLPALAQAEARLRKAADKLGIKIGSAVDFLKPVPPDVLDLVDRECTIVSPENAGKWLRLQPEDGQFEWMGMDATRDFTHQKMKALNWHCFIWQNGGMPNYMKLPDSLRPDPHEAYNPYYAPEGTLSSANYEVRCQNFLGAIADHYGDQFFRIDVANELFLPHGSFTPDALIDPNLFRKGNWWYAGGGQNGPEWPDQFFQMVRGHFPNAHRVLNEFGVEAVHSQMKEKREALQSWLEGAVMRGCPITGVGLQSHLVARNNYDVTNMTAFAKETRDLGLSLFITEMDVDTRDLPPGMTQDQINQKAADLAALHVRTMLRNGDLKEITWWGISSRMSYLAIAAQRKAVTLEPTLYDELLRKLPMYDAVATELEAAS